MASRRSEPRLRSDTLHEEFEPGDIHAVQRGSARRRANRTCSTRSRHEEVVAVAAFAGEQFIWLQVAMTARARASAPGAGGERGSQARSQLVTLADCKACRGVAGAVHGVDNPPGRRSTLAQHRGTRPAPSAAWAEGLRRTPATPDGKAVYLPAAPHVPGRDAGGVRRPCAAVITAQADSSLHSRAWQRAVPAWRPADPPAEPAMGPRRLSPCGLSIRVPAGCSFATASASQNSFSGGRVFGWYARARRAGVTMAQGDSHVGR